MKKQNISNASGFTLTPKNFGVTSRSQGGFTVLELLVVIAIIVIITALTLALLNGARERSRDGRRLEDLRSIETALNLYAANNQGVYPAVSPAETIDGVNDFMSQTLLGSDVISNIPTDPQHPNNVYQYQSDGNTYSLSFCLETDTVQGYTQGCGNTITQ